MMKVSNRSNKKRKLRKLPCIAVIVAAMFLGITINGIISQNAAASDDFNSERKLQKVTVQSGDSLWTLVEENYNYQGDIRKAIYEVKQINAIDNEIIKPGQVILIPVD